MQLKELLLLLLRLSSALRAINQLAAALSSSPLPLPAPAVTPSLAPTRFPCVATDGCNAVAAAAAAAAPTLHVN